ncbi:hypothetical protein KFK09_006908 [Dendrobium nobile]|uniref:RNase H type-1 domain-containing protein n=1 Tax=Dendrobium nobile TaxID=94219 RepID=A0A8T3BSL3_DENNO|nr:hypothetical protein KFK09_006908 [Dendrobium nobile]
MAGEASSTPWGKVSSKPQDQNKGFFNIDNEEGSPAKSRSFKDVLAGSLGDILPSLSPSTFNRVPAVLILDDDVLKLASPFRFTLVGKFIVRRPNLDAIRSFFGNLKLSGFYSVGLLDSKHVAIQLSNDLDYSRVLHALGSIFGRPLQTDQATASRTGPSVARVLVEMDITKKHAKEPINVDNSDCNEEEPTEDQEEGEYLPEQTLSDSMEKENLYKNGDGRSSDTHSDKVINVQISHNQFNFYASVVYAASTRTGRIPLWDCLTDFAHTINGPCNFTAPAVFRFQNMWIKHTDFLNAVSENWNALVFPDNNIQGMNRLWSKLSRLKQMLRWWNKHVFKNLFDNIKEAEEKVLIADNLYLDNTSAENLANLDHCKLSLFNLQNQEEIFWKQKASNAILVEGDRNTSFFHALVNKNRIRSYIHKIVDEHGVVYDTGDNIAKYGVDFFFNIFNSCKSVVSIVNTNVIPNIVDDTDNNFLTQLPLEEEIWDTIKGMNAESVAGPDGFTTKFFLKTWEIIKVDVVDAVHDFFKAKYCKGLHPLIAHYKNSDSTVWKRICKIKREADLNIQWGVGEGEISFWQDNWIGVSSIDRYLNTHTISNVKVKEFFINDNWNIALLRDALPNEIVDLIIKIPVQMQYKDKIMFKLDSSGKGHILNLIPILIIWYLWKARNESKHEGIKVNANQIIANIRNKVLQLISVNLLGSKHFKNCNTLAEFFGLNILPADDISGCRIICWIKPLLPFVKLNTDGSVGVHSAGFGGIIHNHLGNPLNAFAGPLDVCPVLSAELRSLSFGLERCIILGYHHVNIEVDSKTIIHFISENSIGNPQDLYIIRKIKLMLGEMDYTISHIFREMNVIVINLWNPEFILSKLVFEDFEGAGDAGLLFSFFIHCDKLDVVIWIWLLVCDLLSFAISIKCSGMEANFTFVYISFPGSYCWHDWRGDCAECYDKLHFVQSDNCVVSQSHGLFFDKWQPPPPNWIKINLDASLKGNYEASIGGIVRDCKGIFLLAFGLGKMHWDIAQLDFFSLFCT